MANTKAHIEILRCIIDNYNHSPSVDQVRQAIEELSNYISERDDEIYLSFDGNEYHIISDLSIWDIYVESIRETVTYCSDLKLNDIPSFVAFEIDWEKTAQNCYADGYGYQFSSYDGSENYVTNEKEDAAWWFFRTN
jgi:hypothetical protein